MRSSADSMLRLLHGVPRTRRRHCPARGLSPGGRSSAGFTLFEVVIALALSLLLLTAVYGALRLQYRISESGREQMERAQLSRAVLRLIESDVRSIVWQVQKPPSSEEDSSSSGTGSSDTGSSTGGSGSADTGAPSGDATSDSSTEDSTPLLSSDDAFAGSSSGLYGDSQNLVLHISRPARERVYATSIEDENAAAGRSDLVSVSYFIADGSAGGTSAQVASQAGGGSSVPGGIAGLARSEQDRLSLAQAGGGDASLAESASVIAPEVVAIEFAYWDGLEWLDAWDSASSGTLPSAIGVTLSIDTQTTVEQRTLAGRLSMARTSGESADSGKPVQVRFVIALPLAEPFVSEASI